MNSIVGYESEEDSNESQERHRTGGRQGHDTSRNYRRPAPHEDNYEEVGMDMSNEDSDESGNEKMEDAFTADNRSPVRGSSRSSPSSNQKPRMSLEDTGSSKSSRDDRSDTRGSRKDDRDSNKRQLEETWASRNERKKDHKEGPRERGDSNSDRSDRNPPERRERSSDRHSDSDRYRSREDKRSDRERDGRGDRRDRSDTRGRDDRGRDRDDKDRDRDSRRDRRDDNRRDRDRRHSRTRSRDRRRSRSPRRSSRSPPYRRGGPPFSKREKAAARMDRLDKLGIELNSNNSPQDFSGPDSGKVPPGGLLPAGVTGKFREQIEKRKMLWQRAKEGETGNKTPAAPTAPQTMSVVAGSSKATKVYEATTFADDKQSSKFKRLMGIKDTSAPVAIKNPDVLKKQEEMFSTMEAQYEVARTTTHTMRGVGLGFGSLQR